MCFQGESSAKIGNATTVDSSGKAQPWVDTSDAASRKKLQQDQAQQRANLGLPDNAPDFTDNLIQEARKRQAAQLLLKSNRRDALANNPGTAAPVSYSLLK